jgi:hypothetical protein
MKVFVAFLFLVGTLIVTFHFSYSETEKAYADNQAQIEKESVESAVTLAKVAPTLDPSLNSNLKKTSEAQLSENPRSPAADETEFTDSTANGIDHWCRPVEGQVDESKWLCVYPRSCFECTNSKLIMPAVVDAQPFCSDGTRAVGTSATCCAHTVNSNIPECPGFRECYASNENTQECSCKAGGNCVDRDLSE